MGIILGELTQSFVSVKCLEVGITWKLQSINQYLDSVL